MTVMADEVLLRVTKRIKSSLEEYPDSTILNRIKQTEAGEVIEYGYLSQVFTERQRCEPGKFKYFHEFLEGSGIYEEPYKEQPRNPELLKRLKCLQAELEKKQYNDMVKNVSQSNKGSFGAEFGAEVRSTSKQLMSVINYVISMFGCAVFAYFASEYAWTDHGLRIIFSVIVGTVVALAELYFLARTEI